MRARLPIFAHLHHEPASELILSLQEAAMTLFAVIEPSVAKLRLAHRGFSEFSRARHGWCETVRGLLPGCREQGGLCAGEQVSARLHKAALFQPEAARSVGLLECAHSSLKVARNQHRPRVH